MGVFKMNPHPFIFPVVNLVNRSWHGTRLSPLNSVPYSNEYDSISFGIGFDHTKEKYYIEFTWTLNSIVIYRNGKRRKKQDTYGRTIFFGDTIHSCILWVQENFGIYLNVLNSPIHIQYPDEHLEQLLYNESLYSEELV